MVETYSSDVALHSGFSICFVLAIVLISLVLNVLYVIAFCKIFGKAGYHWAMGLLMLVPIANIIMPLVLAFGEWPIYRQMRQVSPPPQSGEPPRENFRGM